ncbi:MAG: Ig-like domain-containing protein [Fibrobacteres bacterium]|nr:Ig-like domain-containing protein [Fibrobacterota bacterium]
MKFMEAIRNSLMAMAACAGLSLAAALPYSVFPADGSTVPADAPIRITFPSASHAGTAGVFRLRAADSHIVYSLDIGRTASGTLKAKVGGDSLDIHPVIVSGTEAYLFVAAGSLAYGTTYTAEMDAGAFSGANGAYPAASWTFTTAARPASGRSAYTVAADGSGDFCTVQGALDFLAQGTAQVTVTIKPGTYREILRSVGRNSLSLAGTNRDSCVIRAVNNDKQNAGTSARALVRLFGDDLSLRDLTFLNDTPDGGSQAETLFLRGQRCAIRNCVFHSFQDTMQLEGRVYLADCRIEGAVDYIWGRGIAFFRNCALYSNADGYIVQSRNAKGQRGYVFVGCALTAASGVKSSYLARDGNGDYPDGDVRYIDCTMGTHVPKAGWLVQTVAGATPNFAEYGSKDAQGKALDMSGRAAYSRVMTASEADGLRKAVNVVGGTDGWDPEKATGLVPPRPREAAAGLRGGLRFGPETGFDARGRHLPRRGLASPHPFGI